ncbi:MAG TPA: hypothetical protein VFY87_14875, partial [Geminicoccaceae bacterium]|nr:hypothetical protein [Geminicoccaceae bacterium]
RQGIAAYRATGAVHFDPYFLGLLAQAQRGEGQVPEAEETVTEGLDMVRRTGERYYEAELLRLRGSCCSRSPRPIRSRPSGPWSRHSRRRAGSEPGCGSSGPP